MSRSRLRRRRRAWHPDLGLAGAGNPQAAAALAADLMAYTALLRARIDKENNVLFPMADRLFSPAEQ
jgi:hemerythrin-like domain-containing protein